MEKIFVEYVCPSLELIEEEIEWEDIEENKDYIKEFEMLEKTLDNLSEDEQLEYLSDIILNSFME